MRYSQSFIKTIREVPKEAELISHQYLLRGGFVTTLAAGFYTYLPMGFRVFQKIYKIIQEELNKIGVEDMVMPIVHPARPWKETKRFYEVGPELWKIKNRSDEDFVLAMTHEEIVTDAAKRIINSYKDLPKLVGQIQTKVRDEARVRGGLLRLREFTMQDAYSFDRDEAGLDLVYQKFIGAYKTIFERMGVQTVVIESDTGAMGGSGAHEFMMIAESGEDKIVSDGERAVNAEKMGIGKEDDLNSLDARRKIEAFFGAGKKVEFMRGIEVGNIFKLGTKYSLPMKLMYIDENNESKPVIMGSYGIGLDRLIASIIEASHDDKGVIWPKSVAPYQVHLISLGNDPAVLATASKTYDELTAAGLEVFYDDREEVSAGEKFSDADLIGIPYRVTISNKTLAEDSAELKMRNESESKLVKLDKLTQELQ
ncbi:MAG: aminoacyl--tRNA ligase-related protein [Patescibacteria group bacterium]|jgi:prolyl-tRNA synthetase